jgi:hypothetical protein
MSLVAGDLAGESADWVNPDCMARFIDDAMLELNPPPDEAGDSGARGRRQFFIAISRGVIEYLRTHDTHGLRVRNLNGDHIGHVEVVT